jgi:Two component regulator propeller
MVSTHESPESNLKNPAYALLEDHEGTMWFGTAIAGLLKFDREHRRFISYHNLPGDRDSLVDNRVIALFEDREKNIWVGMHDVEPHFFAPRPPPFTKFTNPSGSRNCVVEYLVVPRRLRGCLYCAALGTLSMAHSSAQRPGKASTGRCGNNSNDDFHCIL